MAAGAGPRRHFRLTMSVEDIPLDDWLEGLSESQRLAILKLIRVFVLENDRPRTKPQTRRRPEVTGFMGELGIVLTLWPEARGADETLRRTSERMGYRVVPAGAVAMSFADAKRILVEMAPDERTRSVRFIRKRIGL